MNQPAGVKTVAVPLFEEVSPGDVSKLLVDQGHQVVAICPPFDPRIGGGV